jgi:hypothetical protein
MRIPNTWKLSQNEWDYPPTDYYHHTSGLIINTKSATVEVVRPAEGQAVCMTNGISPVKCKAFGTRNPAYLRKLSRRAYNARLPTFLATPLGEKIFWSTTLPSSSACYHGKLPT